MGPKGSKLFFEGRQPSVGGFFVADSATRMAGAYRVELAQEGVDLLVGGVEMWAHAQSTARSVVVEELPRRELARDRFGILEVEADGPAAPRVLARRVDGEAALLDLRSQ